MDITFKTTPKLEALRAGGPFVARRGAPARVRGLPVGLRGRPRAVGVLPAVLEEAGRPAVARAHVAAGVRRRGDVPPRSARHPGGVRPPPRRRSRGHRHAGRPVDPAPRHRRAEEGVPPRHGRRRDHVGRGLHRAELRLRPRVVAHACGARRRRVGDRRTEDVLHRGPPLQLVHHRRPHRPRLREAAQGHQLLPHADGHARHRAAAADEPRRRASEPGVPRRRPRARQPHARRPQPGLAAGLVRDGRQRDPDLRDRRSRSGGGVRAAPGRPRVGARPAGAVLPVDDAQRRAPRRRPRRPHAARRSRDRRGGREAARATRAAAPTASTCTRRSPRSSSPSSGRRAWRSSARSDRCRRASGRRWRARSTASTADRSATMPAARRR